MKCLALYILSALLLISSCKQPSKPGEPAQLKGTMPQVLFDTTGAGAAVAQTMNFFSKAYNDSDTASLKKLLSDDFLMITGITEHSFFNKDEFLVFIKESRSSGIDLKSPFNYLPGPRKISIAWNGLAASAQDSLSFLSITKQKMVINPEHYGSVYLNAFLRKENEAWVINFISLYPVLKDEL